MSKFTTEMVDNYADKLLIGLTPEENKVIKDALLLYEKNGKVAEDDFELIDKMITESDLNKLENMFKNNNNKRR